MRAPPATGVTIHIGHLKWSVWILTPIAGGILIGLAGYLGTRRVVRRSPLAVLREL